MDNQIMRIFDNDEFGQVRTIIINNEVWFVGLDVAKALGYQKPGEAVNTNVDEMDTALMGVIDSMGRTQQTKCVNESGMYAMVFGSKLPSAKKFKRWVTAEVLPSLRKTGKYEVDRSKLPQGYQVMYEMMDNISEIRLSQINQQKRIDAVEKSVGTMRNDFDIFKDEMPLFPVDTDRITDAAKKKGVEVMGGKDSMAYYDRGLRQTVYRDIYGEIHRQFGVKSYREIPRKDTDRAIAVIERYTPPIVLAERIEKKNAA